MPKLCAYVMKYDSGLAPNPFHGVCTLALCTPNHSKADLWAGDWIVGLASAELRRKMGAPYGWRMIYAMHVDERLGLDAYYRDPRFQCKIPKKSGSVVEQRGDNFHWWDGTRLAHTGESTEHEGFTSDVAGDRVFIGRRYWYFGEAAPILPDAIWAHELIARFDGTSKGIRYAYGRRGDAWTPDDFSQFQHWLACQRVPAEPIPYHLKDQLRSEPAAASSRAASAPSGGSPATARATFSATATQAPRGSGCS